MCLEHPAKCRLFLLLLLILYSNFSIPAFCRALPRQHRNFKTYQVILRSSSSSSSPPQPATMQAPVLLRPAEAPEDLICSICMTLPVQPVIVAPCEHLFCRGCISQALERRCECPVDRQDVEDLEALKKGTLMYRVWSAIPVKCGNHESCAWTGSVGDYSNHADICLEATARRGRHTTDSAEKEINSLKRKLQEVERECAVLQEESTSHDTVNLPCLFNGSYEYRRENVAKLSQLISRYLEASLIISMPIVSTIACEIAIWTGKENTATILATIIWI